MAEENNMSPADVMAMVNGGNNYGRAGMWDNPFMYLIWLALFNGNGFGFGNNAAMAAAASGLNRSDLADGLNNQTVLNDLRTIEAGINANGDIIQNTAANASAQRCSGFANINSNISNGINGLNTSMLGGFNNIGMSILKNGNDIVGAINQTAAAQQIANCNLSHAIQDNKYEMAQNTCAITNAVHQEGEETRKLLVNQQIQDLRDAKESVQRDLQSAQITLANANQTQNILGSLGRYVAYTGCGSNCGCGNGF